MGKDIDWDYVRELTSDPTRFYQGEEAEARMEACLLKMLGKTGPDVTTEDIPGGGFRVIVDFDSIVERPQ